MLPGAVCREGIMDQITISCCNIIVVSIALHLHDFRIVVLRAYHMIHAEIILGDGIHHYYYSPCTIIIVTVNLMHNFFYVLL